jgi:metal-responsive CopG/Arc/MetJ family transcriptional regulator
MPRKITATISLELAQLARIDRVVDELRTTRSEFARAALERALDRAEHELASKKKVLATVREAPRVSLAKR